MSQIYSTVFILSSDPVYIFVFYRFIVSSCYMFLFYCRLSITPPIFHVKEALIDLSFLCIIKKPMNKFSN